MMNRPLLLAAATAASCLSTCTSIQQHHHHEAQHLQITGIGATATTPAAPTTTTTTTTAGVAGARRLRHRMAPTTTEITYSANDDVSQKRGRGLQAPILSSMGAAGSSSPQQQQREERKYPRDELRFSFEPDTITGNPPSMDYKTLLCQLDDFYTDFLQEGRPKDSFTEVKLEVLDWYYDGKEGTDYPVSISYIVNATEETGNNVSPEEIDNRLSSRGFFLKRMVKEAWPKGSNSFKDVKDIQQNFEIWDQEKVDAVDHYKFSTSHCPERGVFHANVSFGFFDGKEGNPSRQEMQDLQRVTDDFMSQQLEEKIPINGVDVAFNVADYKFTEGEAFPLKVSFKVTGTSKDYVKEIPVDILKYHLSSHTDGNAALMKQYIMDAVWKVPPEDTIFLGVKKASMETGVIRLNENQVREGDLFAEALSDAATGSTPDDLPKDITDMTPIPTQSPTESPTTPAPTGSPTTEPPVTTTEPPADPGRVGAHLGDDADSDAVATDDSDAAAAAAPEKEEDPEAEDDEEFDAGFNLGGGVGGIPDSSSVPQNGGGAGLGAGAGGVGGGRPFGGRPGSTLIPGGNLRPDKVPDPICEKELDTADANNDKLITQSEYVDLINILTREKDLVNFPEYVFNALPQKLQNEYSNLATHKPETQEEEEEGHVIPITEENASPTDQIVQDAARKNIICRALKRVINEVVEEEKVRLPARVGPAQIQFLASCDGGNCVDSGEDVLYEAVRHFLRSDIKPIFEARYKEDNAYMAPKRTNITALDDIDCPRQDGDPGDDNVHCYVVSADVEIRCEGDDEERMAQVVELAQNQTMEGINNDLLGESLTLTTFSNPTSWQVYRSLDFILSMRPSAVPTDVPSLNPTMAPTEPKNEVDPAANRGSIVAVDLVPTMAPSSYPTETISEAPTSTPTVLPTVPPESSIWTSMLDMDGATVGWVAAAGILTMIVLQFFRELLVDIVILTAKGIYNGIRRLFGYGTEDDDDSDDEEEGGDDNEKGRDDESSNADASEFEDERGEESVQSEPEESEQSEQSEDAQTVSSDEQTNDNDDETEASEEDNDKKK